MNRPMRRHDRQLSDEATTEVLQNGKYGVLATVSNNCQPYGVPVSYAFDGKKFIYLHGASAGHKLDNLRQNPHVSFTVVGKAKVVPERLTFEYESAIVSGIAVEVKEDDEKRKGLRLLASKYSSGYEQAAENSVARKLGVTTIVRIEIEKMTGKGRGSGK